MTQNLARMVVGLAVVLCGAIAPAAEFYGKVTAQDGHAVTAKSTLHPLPEFAPGYRPAAYVLAVHRKTQKIWVNETITDQISLHAQDQYLGRLSAAGLW